MFLSLFSFTAYVPTLSPSLQVFPSSYMGRECGVDMKYRISTPSGTKVPNEVYKHLSFKETNFRSGYFSSKSEKGGTVIKVSFQL